MPRDLETHRKREHARYWANREIILEKQRATYSPTRTRKRYDTIEGRAQTLFNNARYRARTRGIEFSISLEDVVRKLRPGVCEVSGLPFEYQSSRSWGPSLDRKTPSRGYTPDNIQCVCWLYNMAKGVNTHEDVLRLSRALLHVH